MKRNRWIVVSIIVINICIIGTCIFLLMGEDRTAPEFRFQTSDYTYLKSDGESLLLQNIIAYDDRDGDITDRIVIEKLTENQDSNTVVVYYAVSDLAGNVAKVSRIFPMEPSDEVPEYVIAKQEETAETESGISGTKEADKTEETGSDQEDKSEDAAGGESEEPEDENGGGEQEDENGGEEQEDEDGGEEEDEEQEDERAEEEPPKPAKPVVDKSGYPVLTLKKKEVTIEAGTSPPWTELIETMRDDKDDYTALYYNLHISKFTAGKAGDYPVTLQAEDSDGNLSDPVTITVHVR